MIHRHLILFIVAFAISSATSADQPTVDWRFSESRASLGWSSAGGSIGVDASDGAMTFSGDVCRMISQLFEIKPTPWQYVEIEMKSDSSGVARFFYSDTTAEPYNGFREKWHQNFAMIGDEKYHKYIIFPCWQKLDRVIHIRLDPSGTHNAVKSIRIIDGSKTKSSSTIWQFPENIELWNALTNITRSDASSDGWHIKGGRDCLLFSPTLEVRSDTIPKLSLRIASKTSKKILFHWLGADSQSLSTLPIELKNDGKFHTYSVEMGNIAEWNGTILRVGLSPSDSDEESEIILHSISLARKTIGPAEIQISRLWLDNPVSRVGSDAVILMEVKNTGGAAASHVSAQITLTGGDSSRILPGKSISSLPAGKTARFEWNITFASADEIVAVSRADSVNTEPDRRQAKLKIYPKLDRDVSKQSYVPEPQIADTGDYLVGCYYFPGWRDWAAWSVLDDYPERRPILGYAHNGNPEVVDWQIKWALEHGIGFFIYDWYWNRGSRGLEEGLHDGFLKSRYQDKMKFCLLWANHNDAGSHSEADMVEVTQFWINNYFNRPNYLKIDGKNVMVIFNPHGITSDIGSEATKAIFNRMNKLCEDAQVGGIYFVACGQGGKEWAQQLANEGYDAISGYNYPSAGDRGQAIAPYSWMVDAYKDIWNRIADVSEIPYIPICEAGWDSRPWGGPSARVRTGKSAALWQKMLVNAKEYFNDERRNPPGGKKLVFCEAWNEFGEGDYIEPTAEYGFEYLEAIRKVFSVSENPPAIITPKDLGLGPYDIAMPAIQFAWDFSKPADRVWSSAGMTSPQYETGALAAQALHRDPILSARWVKIDADKFKFLEIRMKTDRAGEAQVFFKGDREALNEEKSVRFRTTGDNQFHTYRVNMGANQRWQGTVSGLRFDPTDAAGSHFEIANIKFAK